MNHKYLEDIDIKLEDTPYGWNSKDKRQPFWQKQREEYGFDERETWSLDATFFYWLYERLSMYNEINIVDTSHHKFTINEKEMTLQECIDRMLFISKQLITFNETDWEKEEKIKEEAGEIFDILKACIWCLWW